MTAAIRRCDMCQVPDGAAQQVRRHFLRSMMDGALRGTGAISLCDQCWRLRISKRDGTNRPYTPHFERRRLTAAQVREIRAVSPRYGYLKALSRKYGVSDVTIGNVRRGAFYREVAA